MRFPFEKFPKKQWLLVLLLVGTSVFGAEKKAADYRQAIADESVRFERLLAGKAVPDAGPAALENAVYPLMYSPKKRMTGNLADWTDIPYTGKIRFQCDSNRLPLPDSLQPGFKAAISNDTLYLLLFVSDPTVVFNVSNVPYLNDCFELFLDPLFQRRTECDDTNSQTFLTASDKTGKKFFAYGKVPMRVQKVLYPGGWAVEAAIPLENPYFKMKVFDGLAFGVNITYCNNDTPGKARLKHKLSWSALDTDDSSYRVPSVYGVFRVVSPGKNGISAVTPGSAVEENRKKRRAGETLADYSVLAKEKPSPAIVRGFQIGLLTEQTAKDAAAWGSNVLRFAFHPKAGKWERDREKILEMLEKKVRYVKASGQKAVIAMQPSSAVWKTEEAEREFITVWKDVAARLKPLNDAVWAYDLYNEPLERSALPYAPHQWRGVAVKTIKEIRKIDREVWFIYETGPGGGWRGFEDLSPLPDTRVIYSFHFYQPGTFTHQGIAASQLQDAGLMAKEQKTAGLIWPGYYGGLWWDRGQIEKQLAPVIEFQEKYKVPVFVGEFSVVVWAPVGSAVQYLQDSIDVFEKYGWSWTYHAFREWPGWSLEHEDGVLTRNIRKSDFSARAPIVRKALQKNSENKK